MLQVAGTLFLVTGRTVDFPRSRLPPQGGPADDGKRSDLVWSCTLLRMLLREKKKERVWERKGLGIGPERRLADSAV